MTDTLCAISGTGLITGKMASVTLTPSPQETGIVFQMDDILIPARPEFVVNSDRGVTLGKDGKTLSIVEHFLSACAMTGHHNLHVCVSGAPELPLLDGSAAPWVTLLQEQLGSSSLQQHDILTLEEALCYQHPTNPAIQILALPSDQLEIAYLVDFPHPDLNHRWFYWCEPHGPLEEMIAPARTFGFAEELPVLQAQGLALGVTTENTLGLTAEGGYTSPLRFDDEPIRHKILDLIGDLMLCGIPARVFKAKIIVFWGGHTAHLAFGKQLHQQLYPC